MTDHKILKEMIHENARIPLSTEYEKHFVVLEEPDCTECRFVIKGLPEQTLVIKSDSFETKHAFFKGAKGELKRADYILIANDGVKKRVVYFEMKKGTKAKHHIEGQLKGAKCLLHYCKEIGKEFWKEPNFLRDYQEVYISISHLNINKKTTRFRGTFEIHDSPNKFLRIKRPNNIQYKHLISGTR